LAHAKQKKAPGKPPLADHLVRGIKEGTLLIFGFVALYLFLALVSYHAGDPGWTNSGRVDGQVSNLGGPFGAWFADIFYTLFGYPAYLFPAVVAYSGLLLYRGQQALKPFDIRGLLLRSLGFVLTVGAGCALASMHDNALASSLPVGAGGILGDVIGNGMESVFSFLGATLLLLALFFAGVTLFTHLSWLALMDRIGEFTLNIISRIRQASVDLNEWLIAKRQRRERETTFQVKTEQHKTKAEKRVAPIIAPPVTNKPVVSQRAQRERQVPLFTTDGNTVLPPLALLDEPEVNVHQMSKEALEHISRLVELKLADFGVEVQVVEVQPGPVITRYELQPAAGVKVSQITNLAKDLARSISAISVRVVEVIPGKTTVGIEIPNEEREVVRLVDNLKSKQYEGAKSPLTLALGKDISGEPMVADLARMPHLLVAGTTGAGKSVALNAMILSLLYNAQPKDVRLILIDPKMLELSIYDDIPHLLAPVVTDMKEAANALRWCVAEMDRRYRLMSAMKVRNIAGFNKKVEDAMAAGKPLLDPLHPANSELPAQELNPLPFIVVVVDELADMMMVVGKKVEELIARLAQKARASGIHLILATQRPSVDVLTGLIKSNIPTRIAFQVSSRVDSRTILDQMGAEQLLGHGDMLYLPPGTAVPIRVHGAFVDDQEVHNVVEYLKAKGKPQYEDAVLDGPTEPDPGNPASMIEETESDPLYDQAVRIVTETRKASISGVQRRLKIGYNRAARMVEAMEASGLVGPLESNGSREVIAPPPPKD